MGNCGNICNTNISKLKGDIILNSVEQETEKYLDQTDKLIFIQRNIKKYLKKIKNKKKLKFKTNDKNGKKSSIPNEKEQKMDKGNKNMKKNNKYITYDEEEPSNEFLIPTINTPLMEKNIFENDPFRNKNRSNQKNNNENNINDPRDGPMDGIRRKFPKIKEDQSSYEGEWKDGKRDGLGVLCWGDESKFMGKFEEDKVIGYGKLWHDDEIYIKDIGMNFKQKDMEYIKLKKGLILEENGNMIDKMVLEWKVGLREVISLENIMMEIKMGLDFLVLEIRLDTKENFKKV